MQTVIETDEFEKLWPMYWTEKERDTLDGSILKELKNEIEKTIE